MRLYLDIDLYKAASGPPSEEYEFSPLRFSGLPPTKANIDEQIWVAAQKYDIPEIYDALVATAKQESGRTHWRNRGRGKIITSPTDAQGVMQLMARTARGLGVDRKDWRQNILGGVKLWSINYKQALKSGMSPSDAVDYAAMAYYSGGAGGKDPSQNTSAVEVHNQRALARHRRKNPNATIWDVPSSQLKGAPSQVSKFGGIKNWRKNMQRAMSRGAGIDSTTGKKTFGGALDRYARGIKRRSEADRHYVRVGKDRAQAERHGLKGYTERDSSGRGIASMPIRQTMARPEDLRPTPSKPKSVASEGLYLKSPVAAPARKQAETKRVAGLDAASKDLGLPAPSKVLSRQPKSVAVQPRPPVKVSKSLFQSEYFIEV